MSEAIEIASALVVGAPPGELDEVTKDIGALTADTDPQLVSRLRPAYQKYNEEQLVAAKLPDSTKSMLISRYNRLAVGQSIVAKLPDSTKSMLISRYNRLADGRYFDSESGQSFEFDHLTQTATSPQTFSSTSAHDDLIGPLLRRVSSYTAEHYPAAHYGVYGNERPDGDESEHSIAILIASNKYSPQNFWNGRWRSSYLLTLPSSPADTESAPTAATLSGTINLTVHYYEDGNVNLTTSKSIHRQLDLASPSDPAGSIIDAIAQTETAYQADVNRAFVGMNEDGFKALRRHLPITRQKVEWDKVAGYRLGGDLKGGHDAERT